MSVNQIYQKAKKNDSIISNLCNKIIKNSCMTFNGEIDNITEDNDSISMKKSMRFKDDFISKNNENLLLNDKKINGKNQKIIVESYLYKMTKSGKLKKIYFKLYNYDLYYYKNENSKFHKGMHNLSTFFIEFKPIFPNNKVDTSYLNFKYKKL